MKLTKFGQSCFLIETNGKKLLIDPGSLRFNPEFLETYWKNVDYIFITHRHGDHIYKQAVMKMIENGSKLYTTSEVKKYNPELECEIVNEGDTINLEDYKVEVVKAIHGYLPHMKKADAEILENVGYIVVVEGKRIYHTSDTICFNNEYKCDILLLPMMGYGVTMGTFEAPMFARETQATLIIPMHQDNINVYPVDLNEWEEALKKHELNYKMLDVEDSIEL